jgi:glycosyltransferase involved in cell wall biosynthesis
MINMSSLKILLVNTYHFRGGGDSTYTFNLAELLRNYGHNVAFFAMQDIRNLPDPNADLFVSNIDFRKLNRKKNPLTGLRVLCRAIYSVEARKKFNKLLSRFKPDIIHLQNIHAHITPSIIFEAKRYKIPVVWTLHDYKLICPNSHFLIDKSKEICEACGKNSYYKAIQKRCKKGSLLASTMASIEAYTHRIMKVKDQVDMFLAPSKFLRNKLIEYGFSKEKVVHMPLFIPENFFKKDNGNRGYFLFLGKLEPIKGIYQLLEASRIAQDAKLILAGRVEEPLASELSNLLSSNAQYVGVKQGRELQELLQDALALVLPSIWYENQPFAILEAFARGKPVIASRLGGMIELVEDGVRGILVPPGDIKALAESMEWMVNHPEVTKKMGESAYEYVLYKHHPEIHYRQLKEVYAKILSKYQ